LDNYYQIQTKATVCYSAGEFQAAPIQAATKRGLGDNILRAGIV